MAERQASKIRESDVVGLKYFDRLMPMLDALARGGHATRPFRQSSIFLRPLLRTYILTAVSV